MRDRPVTFELLNAYVDGELDAAQAAKVARAVADDPALAREVAALSRLRMAVADGIDAPAITLPKTVGPRRPLAAAAASIAVALFLGGAAFLSGMDRPTAGAGWLAEAWQAHLTWTAETSAPDALVRVHQAKHFASAYVPDLTASRLTLIHSEVRAMIGGGQALLAGYRGTRGCKVSLIVFPAKGDLIDTLRPFRRDGQEAYGWRVGRLDYLMLSDGMESRRFGLLAESVHAGSRRHAPFDAETRTALRESRDNSAPCNA
tara:strand:+ start:761 stop:1540 length:780 start_codon:yes stop_codon:yes gene_type:complete